MATLVCLVFMVVPRHPCDLFVYLNHHRLQHLARAKIILLCSPGKPVNSSCDNLAEIRIGICLIVVAGLVTEDPGVLVLPRPCDGLHALRVVCRKQDITTFSRIVHGISFVHYAKWRQASCDMMFLVGNLYVDCLVGVAVNTTSILNSDDVRPQLPFGPSHSYSQAAQNLAKKLRRV